MDALVKSAADLDRTFEVMSRGRNDALLVPPDPFILDERTRVAESAARFKIPAMYSRREMVEAGGLMSYGVNLAEVYRTLLAGYTDKILRGAKPGDLPVVQPTKFELVINIKTAKALGLTIPPPLLLRADQIIE